MELIELDPIPNQSFIVNVGGNRYDITIREIDGLMAYDIAINETEIPKGFRFVIGQLMIPYKRLVANGNFILSTPPNEEPNYLNFGTSQFLYYLTNEEVEQYQEALLNGQN